MATLVVALSTQKVARDWRFAQLVARALNEPDLWARYTKDPRTVLAEFGLHLDEWSAAPTLPVDDELVIQDLRSRSAMVVPSGFCTDGPALAA